MIASTVIVTGASKGFGRAVAKAFARLTDGDVHFIITGRAESDLLRLQDELRAIRSSQSFNTTCDVVVADLGNDTELPSVAERLFSNEALTGKSVTFVNNAGTLGPMCTVGSQKHNFSETAKAVSLNLTNSLFLTTEFVRRIERIHEGTTNSRATVVNVSSLAAILAIPGWATYCSTRAARDMYHSVLAEEQKKKRGEQGSELADGEIRVLNYAPGPMDTDMQKTIRDSEAADPSFGTWSTEMHVSNNYVDKDASAEKLVKLLRTPGAFASGAHVDYFDAIDGLI